MRGSAQQHNKSTEEDKDKEKGQARSQWEFIHVIVDSTAEVYSSGFHLCSEDKSSVNTFMVPNSFFF